MHNENVLLSPRRSSRVPVAMPILVTSLDGAHFSEVCETLVVNAHGCAIRSRAKLDPGVLLHFHSKDGRGTTAQVVSCQPMERDSQSWRLAAELEHPGNFWGLQNFPKDWTAWQTSALPEVLQLAAPAQNAVQLTVGPSERSEAAPQSTAAATTPLILSEEYLKKVIVELVRPLHAEITAMREKLARADANRSRFEVSLSSIPPELEQQLEQRLRQDLSPKVIEEARQESSRTLSAAKMAIKEMVVEVQKEFQSKSKEELAVVEQRAGQLSAHIVEAIREQLRDGVGDLQRKLVDGRNQLRRTSDELLISLQTSLNDEHNARREELEQLRVQVAAESLRLHEQIEQLDNRVSMLDESLRSWESGLDGHLSQMATETVNSTRNEIESVADNVLQELKTRSAQTLSNQMDEAAGDMRIVQQGVVASVSESLKTQSADALQEFEQSMDELAHSSIERCRSRIAAGLNAVTKNLGEHFQTEHGLGSDDHER
jgi:exonuclease VII small subunit